ncbi:uncharacterized protein K452DRAFT_293604 [Aplosporella prunicola CBS 121167]|uniref:Endoplasmic reticulum-based factor for assembly of V-ATPase n=1 Tax=Aplosporella prunicola CBS 121167 TaxID=1176127 RepID=A0A6A6BUV6_9PEZI|nr:uncharacterized protein K452DRAFT_293604 [Aplosporella prunicola CBS 121167]KAF2147133.1 hypothetical protein K452DRAFT_293604 [Aplosporella prunicola CBS 121167]
MTPAVVQAVHAWHRLADDQQQRELPQQPELAAPAPGAPISHAQLLRISSFLTTAKSSSDEPGPPAIRLNDLLRGARIYVPPPPPKPEPTPEYKALMARLRASQESLAYSLLLTPPTAHTPSTLPRATPHAHSPATLAATAAAQEADEATYADVNRQLALIANVLISIVACSVALWIAARHWSVPRRLALSMGGSILVAVAEVAIYAGYIRRVREAKEEEKVRAGRERREVESVWVIGKGGETRAVKEGEGGEAVEVVGGREVASGVHVDAAGEEAVRRRKGPQT